LRILLLTSGGDAPGMNAVLHYLTKSLTAKKHKVFASKYGFQGLLENNVIELNAKLTKLHKNKAGSFIKSSRCLEFKEEKGKTRAIQTLEENKIDLTIIIGGDGSFKGATSLVEKGKNVLFLPATIDMDLHYKTYSMGFYTAVSACCNYIENVKLTMEAFDRICVYQVMGRLNSSLTNLVGEKIKADLVITNESKNKLDFDTFVKKHKQKPALTVLLQENLMPISHVESMLAEKTGGGVRSCVIGYVQRGTNPTQQELKMAKIFANYAVSLIKKEDFGLAIALDDNTLKNIKLI
jgi:6-phosphofructokinase 1